MVPNHVSRELVIIVPLPEGRGLSGAGKRKVRRSRSRLVELGARLREFRIEHGLTRAEVARPIGVGYRSICRWEAGGAVPDGSRGVGRPTLARPVALARQSQPFSLAICAASVRLRAPSFRRISDNLLRTVPSDR